MSAHLWRSSQSTNVTAIPVFPARPVRPTRWRYVFSSSGIVWLMTWVTSSTSMPRAATSVAIRTSLLAGLERRHRPLALLLVQVAVHRRGVEPAVGQFLDELRGGTLGPREDDGLAATLGLQDARDHLVLVERVRAVDEVLDVGLREALVGVARADVDRLAS